jgi:hypothetical protein
VNDDPGESDQRLSNDSSFSWRSSSLSDSGWMTATYMSFMSGSSNKVAPIEDVRLPMMRSVQQPKSIQSKSFLVKAFVEQTEKGDMTPLH